MSDYDHFAIFNAIFSAPPKEYLRLVKNGLVISVDHNTEKPEMTLIFRHKDSIVTHFLMVRTDANNMLEIPLNGFFSLKASSWLGLAETMGTFEHTLDFGTPLIALLRQVGGDTKFENAFRLELNG